MRVNLVGVGGSTFDAAFGGTVSFHGITCHVVAVEDSERVGGNGLSDAVWIGDAIDVEMGHDIVGHGEPGEGEDAVDGFHFWRCGLWKTSSKIKRSE